MRKFTLIFSLIALYSCGQDIPQETQDKIKQNESFWKNRTEIMNKDKNTQEYPIKKDTILNEERTNRIYIRSTGWQFEVYVNDVLLFDVKGEQTKGQGGTTGSHDINQLLLTSGTHEIKVLIYPTYGEKVFGVGGAIGLGFRHFKDRDLRTMVYNEEMGGSFGLVLDQDNEQWVSEKGIYGEPDYVEADYYPKAPLLLKGLPIYEWRSTFEAEVAYDLIGWRNSVNLKKEEEEKDLKKELFEEYKKVHQIIKNKDTSAYLALIKEREELVMTALFYRENEKKQRADLFVEMLANSDYELEPLYEEVIRLEYQGYGKLANLLHLADGEGIIRLRNKKDPEDIIYMDLLFQRKKKGDKLTVI